MKTRKVQVLPCRDARIDADGWQSVNCAAGEQLAETATKAAIRLRRNGQDHIVIAVWDRWIPAHAYNPNMPICVDVFEMVFKKKSRNERRVDAI